MKYKGAGLVENTPAPCHKNKHGWVSNERASKKKKNGKRPEKKKTRTKGEKAFVAKGTRDQTKIGGWWWA